MSSIDITENYHRGNPQSRAAKKRNEKNSLAQSISILALLARLGPRGATSDEAENALDLAHQSCSPRFTELRQQGLIKKNGELRDTKKDCPAAVHVLTRKGKELIDDLLDARDRKPDPPQRKPKMTYEQYRAWRDGTTVGK